MPAVLGTPSVVTMPVASPGPRLSSLRHQQGTLGGGASPVSAADGAQPCRTDSRTGSRTPAIGSLSYWQPQPGATRGSAGLSQGAWPPGCALGEPHTLGVAADQVSY